VAWWLLAATLCGAAWLVDPFAEAAFDAPKWLCVMTGAVGAAAVLAWPAARWNWRNWSGAAKGIALASIALLGWTVLVTALSTHPALAWPAFRAFAIMGLFSIIGASRVLEGVAGHRMFGVFLLACTSSALLSLAQSGGVGLLPVIEVSGRFATGALLGNEGYVALACALMAPACIACALDAGSLRRRLVFVLLAVLAFLVIVLNQQKTSAVAAVISIVVVIATRWRLRWLLIAMAGTMFLAVASVSLPVVREATWSKIPIEQYQLRTTYRLGAWISAWDMAAEHPLFGYGPGTFRAEAVDHQLAAEIRLRERLATPEPNSFVYAHQDYLQWAAEAGLPALLLLLAAMAMLLTTLIWRVSRSLQQQVLIAILSAGAVSALAWFPMHIPLTSCVLLLCAGRAWRLIATPDREHAI
jgi:O-antigen ligase